MYIQAILVLILGYLIGSLSPAYILGKFLKGIDLREHGDCNLGATNVKRVLGIVPAVAAAIFDLTKGLLAMEMAYLAGLPEIVIYCSGFLAIIGHIFPPYLNFRGGKGAATASGLLIFAIIYLFNNYPFPWLDLLVLLIFILSIFWIVRNKTITIFFSMFFTFYIVLADFPFSFLTIFILALLLFIFLLNFVKIIKERLLELDPEISVRIKAWRTIMRPLAMIFPITYFFLSKENTLYFIGIVAAFFLLIDLIRLLSSRVNLFFFGKIKKIFKEREKGRFSSITLFLVSTFLVIFFFPKDIAIYAVSFMVFGDVFAKYFGLKFGKTRIFEKTFEGSLAHFAICLVVGVVLLKFLSIPVILILAGTLVATIFELIPIGINDNFAVSFSVGTVMFLLHKII